MKIIPRFYHAVLDYVVAIVVLLAPNILGFADAGGAATWVPRIVGMMLLLQAIMTNYELGLLKIIPFAMHLMSDYVAAACLIIAPSIFDFGTEPQATVTLVVIGLLVLGVTAMTQPRGRPREALA